MDPMLRGMQGGPDDVTDNPNGYDKLISGIVGKVYVSGIWTVVEKVTSDWDVGIGWQETKHAGVARLA